MEIDIRKIIEDLVDYLMPELSPHEASMYIFLFRNSYLSNGSGKVRIGQRTIAHRYGRGPKKSVPSRAHVMRQLSTLEKKGCIRKSDTTREGTLYEILLPSEIPMVAARLAIPEREDEEDYYHDPVKRRHIYEQEQWTCFYCRQKVTNEDVTLDHLVPPKKGGTYERANLRTACLLCNSIKSGKTYEEAAPLLSRSILERRSKESKM